MEISGEGAFQAEKTASEKALGENVPRIYVE